MKKKVCVMGLGYIGLPTAALLSNRGYQVHGVDVIKEVVDIINQGEIHIIEPELDIYVKAAVNSGRLTANLIPCSADIYIIAVPTPLREENKPDLSYVIQATKDIIPYIDNRKEILIILESTSPVGTTKEMEALLIENDIEISKVALAYCPERVLPGRIMQELVQNDRVVGGITEESTKKVKAFYKTFVDGEIYETSSSTAELVKLSENAFRDTNIAFANELSIICDKFDINVWELVTLANKHPRVNILTPGVGVGGHCIAVDPWFIINSAQEESKLIKSSREVNLYKTKWIIEKIKNKILEFKNKYNREPIVSCLGITFKPNIDDLRESPALEIVKTLIADEYNIKVVEPNIREYQELKLVDLKESNEGDLIFILVAHDDFRKLKIDDRTIDFCGVLNESK